jgi:hypothetical protein
MLNMLKKRDDRNSGATDESLFSDPLTQEVRRAAAFLDDRIRKGERGDSFTETVLLTPQLAELLLKRNPDNRAIRDVKVANYAADIKAGRWELNGESIKISKDGLLNDGQHRCRAVIDTGTSIRTKIDFGLDRETRKTLDQGAVRLTGDYFAMDGVPNAHQVAAVTSLVWQYEQRGRVSYEGHLKPTKQEQREVLKKHPEINDCVASLPRKGASMAGGVSVLAFCLFVFAKRDMAAAATFVTKLIEGDGLAKRDPIFICRERIHADKRMRLNDKVELIFRAWNAWRRGKQLGKLQVMGGELPSVE